MTKQLTLLLSVTFLSTTALAAPAKIADKNICPAGFVGQLRTLVAYTPGPQMAKAIPTMPAHFEFLAKRMKSKDILYSGPMVANGKPDGRGLAIYSSADLDAVGKIVESDPLVKNKVSTYAMDTWLQCEEAKK